MNQGVSVERTEVFPWTDLIVHCTQVRTNPVTMVNSANSEWKRATCNEIKDNNNLIGVSYPSPRGLQSNLGPPRQAYTKESSSKSMKPGVVFRVGAKSGLDCGP